MTRPYLRLARGDATQQQFAKMSGLAASTISFCESGRRKPTRATLAKWALGAGVPLETLTAAADAIRAKQPTGEFLLGSLTKYDLVCSVVVNIDPVTREAKE